MTITDREAHLVGKAFRSMFEKMAEELAVENAKQFEYIDRMFAEGNHDSKTYKLYLAQWKDGVQGQARVLHRFSPHGYDIELFYMRSGWAGPHQDHDPATRMLQRAENTDG